MSTEVQARESSAPETSPVDKVAATLTAARIPEIKALLARKGDSALTDSILGGTVALSRVMTVAENGVAVGCFVLGERGVSGADIASNIGRSPGRVSQLQNMGRIIAACGLPEGWSGKLRRPYAELERAISGKGSKLLREVGALKVGADVKRAKVVGVLDTLAAEREQAAADAKAKAAKASADRKAGVQPDPGKVTNDPTGKAEGTDAPAPVEAPYGDKIEVALADLRRVASWLSTRTGDMTNAQQDMARESLRIVGEPLLTARKARTVPTPAEFAAKGPKVQTASGTPRKRTRKA